MNRFTHLFNKLVDEGIQIDPDIRSAVYSTVSCHGNALTFEQLKNIYMATDVADERVRLLACIGKSKDDQARGKAQEFILSVSFLAIPFSYIDSS